MSTLQDWPGAGETLVHASECEHCPARDVGLFADVDGAERERLLERLRHTRGPGRTPLYHEGSTGHDLYIVRMGLIKLEKRGIEGATRIVRLARPGDVIGLEIILGEAYRHSACAMTHFDACRVPVDLVTHAVHRINGLDRKLFRQWQASVDAAHVFLTELSTGTIRTRVARLLLYLLEPAGRDVCPAISREEIGELLGVTTESASRAMAELKRRGLLDEHGPACRCNVEGLRTVAAER